MDIRGIKQLMLSNKNLIGESDEFANKNISSSILEVPLYFTIRPGKKIYFKLRLINNNLPNVTKC